MKMRAMLGGEGGVIKLDEITVVDCADRQVSALPGSHYLCAQRSHQDQIILLTLDTDPGPLESSSFQVSPRSLLRSARTRRSLS